MSSKDQVSSFFSGFFIGALIGAATALLLAPQSGEETRTQLREKGIELKETAEATYADVSQKAEAAYSDMVQQGKHRMDEFTKWTEDFKVKAEEAIAQISKGKEVKEVEEVAEEAPAEA